MEKKRKETIAVIAVFVVFGTVAAYQFIPWGQSPAVKGVVEEPRSYREQLVRFERLAKMLPQHKRLGEELQERMESYTDDIPPESDHTWLSRRINRTSKGIGVEDLSQKYRPVETSGRKLAKELVDEYAEKVWEIRMRCGYHELGKFLSSLEGSNRFLEVVDISIEGDGSPKQKIMLLIRYIVRKGKTGS